MTPTGLLKDIHDQPDALKRLLSQGWASVAEAARRIHSFKPEWVCIAARGTSDNAARFAKHLLGAHNRLGVGLATPSLFSTYGAPPNISRAVTIGISQSGQSANVISVVEEANRQGGMTLAITNDPSSPLARLCRAHIKLVAPAEKSSTATKTYTNQLMVAAMLSVALEKETTRWDALTHIPKAAIETFTQESHIREIASQFVNTSHFAVIGQGFNYCTAHEIALKLGQTSHVAALPFSASEVMHGPYAIFDKNMPVIIVAPSGLPSANLPGLLAMTRERGAKQIIISDQQELLDQADIPVPLPHDVPEWLSPITSIIPGQLFANYLSMAKGLDPDAPRLTPEF